MSERNRLYEKRYYRSHREQVLVRSKRYYRSHREQVLARQKARSLKLSPQQRENVVSYKRDWLRARSAASHKRLDAKSLARCRKNPQSAGTVAGRRRVVCLGCGRCYDTLPNHLRAIHGMSVSQYRTDHGLNAPVISLAYSVAVGKAQKRVTGNVRRSRLGIRRIPDWSVLEGIVAGKSYVEIGKDIHRWDRTAWRRAKQLGFTGKNHRYDFGRRFDSVRIRQLKEASGLYPGEFATELGLPKRGLDHITKRPKSLARKLIPWRDEILARLLQLNFSTQSDLHGYSRASVLLALVPEVPSNYRLLLMVLKRLRPFLRENRSASLEEVRKYVCEGAIIEMKERDRKGIFRRFLPLAPELIGSGARRGQDELRRDFVQLRNPGKLPSTRIAVDWLASRWGIKPYLVKKGLLGRSRIVPPQKMRELILSLKSGGRTVATVQKPQRKPGRPAARQEVFRQAGKLHRSGKTWRQIAAELSPGENSKSEGQRLRAGVGMIKAREKAHKKALNPAI